MNKVTIYSKDGCGSCVTAKMFMDNKNISYTVVDVDENKDAFQMLIDKGLMTLPYIKIGDKEIKGFKPAEILAAIK